MTKRQKGLLITKTRSTSLLLPTRTDMTRKVAENRRQKTRQPLIEENDDAAFPTIVTWQGRANKVTPAMNRWLGDLSDGMQYHDTAQCQLLNYVDKFMSTFARQAHPHASAVEEAFAKARRYSFDPNTEEMARRLAMRGVDEYCQINDRLMRAMSMLDDLDPDLAKRLESELDIRRLDLGDDILDDLRHGPTLPLKAGIIACADDIAMRRCVTLLRRAMYRKVKTGDARKRA